MELLGIRIRVPGDSVSAPFVRFTTGDEKGIVAVSPRDLLFFFSSSSFFSLPASLDLRLASGNEICKRVWDWVKN